MNIRDVETWNRDLVVNEIAEDLSMSPKAARAVFQKIEEAMLSAIRVGEKVIIGRSINIWGEKKKLNSNLHRVTDLVTKEVKENPNKGPILALHYKIKVSRKFRDSMR